MRGHSKRAKEGGRGDEKSIKNNQREHTVIIIFFNES
jgi:hypothetical protein